VPLRNIFTIIQNTEQLQSVYKVYNKLYYLQVSITGHIDQKALFEAQQALMLHPEYPHKNSLWVLDGEVICDFSNIDFFETVKRIKTFFPAGATKKKGAMFAAGGFQYAMLKLFCEEACRERVPFEMKPFQSYLEAENWLI